MLFVKGLNMMRKWSQVFFQGGHKLGYEIWFYYLALIFHMPICEAFQAEG